MASYVTPKRAAEYIFYIGLESQATSGILQSNPTIASGDFKVSKDGGSLTNLNTLPAVTPSSSKMVKVTLSATEMTADNVTVVCSDAAGDEWYDLLVNIQTTARQIDDLAATGADGDTLETLSDQIDDVPTAAEILTTFGSAGNLDSRLDAIPTAEENADTLLKRDWTVITGEAARSMLNALRLLRNKWQIATGTLTVYKEDDTTPAWTAAANSETSSDVVTGMEP